MQTEQLSGGLLAWMERLRGVLLSVAVPWAAVGGGPAWWGGAAVAGPWCVPGCRWEGGGRRVQS